jgi:hypothetical protein
MLSTFDDNPLNHLPVPHVLPDQAPTEQQLAYFEAILLTHARLSLNKNWLLERIQREKTLVWGRYEVNLHCQNLPLSSKAEWWTL